MTDNDLRVKVAELCGWERGPKATLSGVWMSIAAMSCWRKKGDEGDWRDEPPDYPHDLNACHEMEMSHDYGNFVIEYERELIRIMKHDPEQPTARCPFLWMATARQRCEAFVRVRGIRACDGGGGMTDKELQIKVAELCGWSHVQISSGDVMWWHEERNKTLPPNDDGFRDCPDYPHDLNACREMEKVVAERLGQTGGLEYIRHLYNLVGSTCVWTDWQDRRNGCEFEWEWVCATARQRCVAFVQVMEGK